MEIVQCYSKQDLGIYSPPRRVLFFSNGPVFGRSLWGGPMAGDARAQGRLLELSKELWGSALGGAVGEVEDCRWSA
jgi:hypothetical protein